MALDFSRGFGLLTDDVDELEESDQAQREMLPDHGALRDEMGLWDPRRFGAAWMEPRLSEVDNPMPNRKVEAYPGAGVPRSEGRYPRDYAPYAQDRDDTIAETDLGGLGVLPLIPFAYAGAVAGGVAAAGAWDNWGRGGRARSTGGLVSGGYRLVLGRDLNRVTSNPRQWRPVGVVRPGGMPESVLKLQRGREKVAIPGIVGRKLYPDWAQGIAALNARGGVAAAQRERRGMAQTAQQANATDKKHAQYMDSKVWSHVSKPLDALKEQALSVPKWAGITIGAGLLLAALAAFRRR